jgi:hypothetical protein
MVGFTVPDKFLTLMDKGNCQIVLIYVTSTQLNSARLNLVFPLILRDRYLLG